jgi:hypothetical protein
MSLEVSSKGSGPGGTISRPTQAELVAQLVRAAAELLCRIEIKRERDARYRARHRARARNGRRPDDLPANLEEAMVECFLGLREVKSEEATP